MWSGSYGTTSTTSTTSTSTTHQHRATPTTTPSSDSNPRTTDAGANSKRLALFIFLPIFLFCYGGACILYCMHKIIKHCIRRKPGKRPSGDVLTEPLATPIPAPAPMQAKIPAIPPSSRSFSAGERAAIYPTPSPPHMGVAEPPRTTRDSSSLVTYQHTFDSVDQEGSDDNIRRRRRAGDCT